MLIVKNLPKLRWQSMRLLLQRILDDQFCGLQVVVFSATEPMSFPNTVQLIEQISCSFLANVFRCIGNIKRVFGGKEEVQIFLPCVCTRRKNRFPDTMDTRTESGPCLPLHDPG